MKRVLLLVLVFILCFSAFAGNIRKAEIAEVFSNYYWVLDWSNFDIGWRYCSYTDDFGNILNDPYHFYIGKGSFLQGTTISLSTFFYIITDDSEGISFYLFSDSLNEFNITRDFEITYMIDSTIVKENGVVKNNKDGMSKLIFAKASASDAFRKALESKKNMKIVLTYKDKKFDFGTIDNSSYKIYYAIKYDANGGNGSLETTYNIEGEKVKLDTGTTISRAGFEFIGWKTSSGQSYMVGEEIIPKSDLTLYAQWERVEYYIRYYANNDSYSSFLGVDIPYRQVKHRGESVTLSNGETLKKYLYELVGWNSRPDGTGISYKLGDTYSIDEDVVLYAQWEHMRGQAGGYIFYDCDYDNTEENPKGEDGLISTECGWRYLEAAPEDLPEKYVFGYYKPTKKGKVARVGALKVKIGSGKLNTEALVQTMGDTAYYRSVGWGKSVYAAKACDEYSIEVDGVTYDDWFLPSIDELCCMCSKLYSKGLGNFENVSYWSSSEGSYGDAWLLVFKKGYMGLYARNVKVNVRPIRAFL